MAERLDKRNMTKSKLPTAVVKPSSFLLKDVKEVEPPAKNNLTKSWVPTVVIKFSFLF